MGTIVAIVIIAVIISAFSGKKKGSSRPSFTSYTPKPSVKPPEVQGQKLSNWKVPVSTSQSYNSILEDSIIDVTGKSYSLTSNNSLRKYANGVPYWAHHYVYSYSEIHSASPIQKIFYDIFKKFFLVDEYLDLEGNMNYAFILLFDLLEEYDYHKNIGELESRLHTLGRHYPKTKPYGISFLLKKMEARGDIEGIARLNGGTRYIYQSYNVYSDNWKLGNKYKSKLNLNEEEVLTLNKISIPINNFCSIEFCLIEVTKIFLATIRELRNHYVLENTTLEQEFTLVADAIAKKHFRFRSGSSNHKYCIESTTTDFYSHIFKLSENSVRENYGHKRKINTDVPYVASVKAELETKIISPVTQVLSILETKINAPNEETEIELNLLNTSRWKIKFEDLTLKYNGNPKYYLENILSLGSLNQKNPSIENIFFEASKFISKYDKETSLKLYVHYLFYDLKSSKFDNKQLTKTIQKNLFKTNEQLHEFEMILSRLIKDKNLEQALLAVCSIYVIKRKKINLDEDSIKEAQQLHASTVGLLNEYLNDEYEDEMNTISTKEISTEEVRISITQKTTEISRSIYRNDLSFTNLHTTALEFFAKNSFTVSFSEFEIFAKSNGVFKNQLVDSINELCYDDLDDVLIEEEDEFYTIKEANYQTLLGI
ncbi:MAG TPA: tellurite resistance TerB C-terminal domain-containing protein [Saprospiraceae bacterium]|nr:tellurite resistance TerB C-terminal domain-containing protein [Saprospiraceae bacterium]